MSKDDTTEETTVNAAAAEQAQTERKGEVVVDESAEAHTLQEQTADERLVAAREEALANHAIEHADDEGDVTSLDKVEE